MASPMVEPSADAPEQENEKIYPSTKKLIPIMGAVYLAFFLVALDRTIIGTAIPTITKDFNSFGDVAWYEAGFLLPLCVLQLSFGRIYKYYSAKWILVGLVGLFEIGSIVCAATPTSNGLIIGRVITGIGAVGIFTGSILLINLLVPVQSRPQVTGGIGAMFGIASIVGPILGGYLTSITWRWCFWINVPIGAVSFVLLAFLAPYTPAPTKAADTLIGRIKELDPIGFILIAPAVICLLFALEWGGVKYPWNSGRIIALFVIFAVCFISFIVAQAVRKEKSTIPPRIVRIRSIWVGAIVNFGINCILVIVAFYLPIWFQAIQGKSPSKSGLSLLPELLSTVVAVIGGGILTSQLGYYTPILIVGGAITIVGLALLSTWTPYVSAGKWIGYQVIVGFGLGMCLQQPLVACQTILSDSDVSIGLSLLSFMSFLGSTAFITVAQTLLLNHLKTGLAPIIPHFDPSVVSSGGATTLRNDAPPGRLDEVLDVYNAGMRQIWYLCLGMACLVFVSSFGMEWINVKGKKKEDIEEATKSEKGQIETEKTDTTEEVAEESSKTEEVGKVQE